MSLLIGDGNWTGEDDFTRTYFEIEIEANSFRGVAIIAARAWKDETAKTAGAAYREKRWRISDDWPITVNGDSIEKPWTQILAALKGTGTVAAKCGILVKSFIEGAGGSVTWR